MNACFVNANTASIKYILQVCCLVLLQTASAQQNLPIIRATSSSVDIKDGELFQKKSWTLSPEVSLDIYYVLKPVRDKKITFYTDIDSISFHIVPGEVYDFVIILNGKDSCYTRISAKEHVEKIKRTTFIKETIPPNLIQEDLRFLQKALEKYHPGIYRYKHKAALDHLFDSCITVADHPKLQLEFAKTIMFLISAIEDGHTGSNIPGLLMEYYLRDSKMFPAIIYFNADKAFIICSKIPALTAGTELLTIDGAPVDNILTELFQYLPSDGKIETKKLQILNYGTFNLLYAWIFGTRDAFRVTYRKKDGPIEELDIPAAFFNEFECDINTGIERKNNLQLDLMNNSTALLTVNSFNYYNAPGNKDFKQTLDSLFNKIQSKKIENLVIDVRGNPGGMDENGALLFSFIAKQEFKYFASIESADRKITPAENPLLGIQHVQPNHFSGKVFVLTDGLSFSTTSDFCAIVKSNHRGMLIGEETGGGYYGNTSGEIKTIELPNSQLTIKVPLYKYVNDVQPVQFKDRGVIPDFIVTPGIDDLFQKKDVPLNFALKLADDN